MIHGSARIEQARDGVDMELPATAGLAKQPPRDIGHSYKLINQILCRHLETRCYFLTTRDISGNSAIRRNNIKPRKI